VQLDLGGKSVCVGQENLCEANQGGEHGMESLPRGGRKAIALFEGIKAGKWPRSKSTYLIDTMDYIL
jgi:hypothetical protein